MSFNEAFKGKRVLITGAGRGVGRALAIKLYHCGATVYALSKTAENLNSLQKECPEIQIICVDLSNWNETRSALSTLDVIDCLVNNAAMPLVKSVMNASAQDFDNVFGLNVKSVMNTCQIIAQKMIDAGRPGTIVNVSTVGGTRPFPLCAIYGSSKAALQMMSQCLAVELGPHKIRVNVFQPACMDTDMIQEVATGCDKLIGLGDNVFFTGMKRRTPTGEVFMPLDQVINTILFLLSDLAPQITGQILAIDGGFLST